MHAFLPADKGHHSESGDPPSDVEDVIQGDNDESTTESMEGVVQEDREFIQINPQLLGSQGHRASLIMWKLLDFKRATIVS